MNVFYSWQSDIDGRVNHYFIRDCLQKAIESLNSDAEILERIELDFDTKGVPGSPNIVNTIFEKIDRSDIFVCDISTMNSESGSRRTPNPNVLIELGYAVRAVGWNKIICVANEAFSSIPDDLPFDLRGQRITRYDLLVFNQLNKREVAEKLISTLKVALKACTESFSSEIFRLLDGIDPQIKGLLLKGQAVSVALSTESKEKLRRLGSKIPNMSSAYLTVRGQTPQDQLVTFSDRHGDWFTTLVLVPMPGLLRPKRYDEK